MTLNELTAHAVDELLRSRKAVLVDVREPNEYASGRIPGALLFPLSSFDPKALPSPDACDIIFHCAGGKRSATAVARCLEAGVKHTTHMTGGIQAWHTAGLPVIS